MKALRLWMGVGGAMLLAASAHGADPATGEISNSVAQRGSFRSFEDRFGGAEHRHRSRPDADKAGKEKKESKASKEGAVKKPEARRQDGGSQRRWAGPGPAARQKDGDRKPSAGPHHRGPSEIRFHFNPQWQARWRPQGGAGQSSWRRGSGSGFGVASWRGPQRHGGHGQFGRGPCAGGRCGFASFHGRGPQARFAFAGYHGKKQGSMGRYGHGGHRHHGFHRHHGKQSGKHGFHRHGDKSGKHSFHRRGSHGHGKYAHRGRHGHKGHFAHRGHGHKGHFAHRGHGNWRHHGMARSGHGQWGRMAAGRWHQRGFAPGQFGRHHGGPHGFAISPWMMRSKWQGFGPRTFTMRTPGPQQFERPWNMPARPAGFHGHGPQAHRTGGDRGPSTAELSARIERLQRALDQLRREAR